VCARNDQQTILTWQGCSNVETKHSKFRIAVALIRKRLDCWRLHVAVCGIINIDIISLECHNSHVPMELLELIRGKKVMVGAIDVATDTIETPEEVANTLREALKYVDADKLYPCTNCGMAPLARNVANGKLNALSAGAEIIRKELANKH